MKKQTPPPVHIEQQNHPTELAPLNIIRTETVLSKLLAMPADVFPSAAASIYGLSGVGAGFGGMLFSLLTGWTVDHFSYVPVFIGFGIMPLIAAAIFWTIREEKA